MIQETPEHIFFTIFSSLLQGAGIYLVLKSYICRYQKSYWFSFLFISIEILHRIFRPMATYWKLSDRIWCLEYIVYLAVFFLIVQMLLRGNLWHHLGNLFCGYLIFNLVGTTSLLGVLYLVSGFNFDAVIYTMHYGNIEHIGPVFFSGVCCIYICKKIMDIFFEIRYRNIEFFKRLQALIWVFAGFTTSFEMVFVGIIVFVILGFICISDQRQNYSQLQNEFVQLNQMKKEYVEKIEEIAKVRHDISDHLALTKIREDYKDNITVHAAYAENYTGIRILDCLLESKIQICRSEKIKVSVKGCELSDYPVTVYDWVSIFSNLLDNAIEACKSVERKQDRFIEVKMREEGDRTVIRITNSKNSAAEIMPAGKKELPDPYKDKRGLGLSIVRETVERNQGKIRIEDTEKAFSVEIIYKK